MAMLTLDLAFNTGPPQLTIERATGKGDGAGSGQGSAAGSEAGNGAGAETLTENVGKHVWGTAVRSTVIY